MMLTAWRIVQAHQTTAELMARGLSHRPTFRKTTLRPMITLKNSRHWCEKTACIYLHVPNHPQRETKNIDSPYAGGRYNEEWR